MGHGLGTRGRRLWDLELRKRELQASRAGYVQQLRKGGRGGGGSYGGAGMGQI